MTTPKTAQDECEHGHTTKTSGCVSCELLYRHSRFETTAQDERAARDRALEELTAWKGWLLKQQTDCLSSETIATIEAALVSPADAPCRECNGTGLSRLYPNEREQPCFRCRRSAWITSEITKRLDGFTKASCDECDDCGKVTMCRYHSLLSELDELRRVSKAPADASIDCLLCGVNVKQVASATLGLALRQHVNWVCAKKSPADALSLGEIETLVDLCRLESSDTSDEEYQSGLLDLADKLRRLRPDALAEEPPKPPRAAACLQCGYPLRPYNSGDTSTWRSDDFCSARCKARSRNPNKETK